MPDPDLVPETVLTPSPITRIGEQLSPAPWQFLFTGEDAIEIASWNSLIGVRIAVQGRMWSAAEGIKPFAFDHTPNDDRTRRLEVFGVPHGYLLNVAVFARTGAPRIGQTFISLHVIRGRGTARYLLATLVQGYLTADQELAFPGSPVRNSVEAGGYLRTVFGTTPAAGAVVSEPVPTGARWELRSVEVQFACSAAAGNRIPALLLIGSGILIQFAPAVVTMAASASNFLYWVPGISLAPSAWTGRSVASLPMGSQLYGGDSFQVSAQGLQAGDQFTAPHFQVWEWLEAQ